MQFDVSYMLELFPTVAKYLHVTLSMAAIATLAALTIGLAVALVKVFKVRGLSPLCDLYLSFFRGTPLLVQMFLLYYGLPQLLPVLKGLDAFTAAIIALSLHFAAYMAESMRGAIISVDENQMEAALSIGMSQGQAMRRIVLPQATRGAIPALMNNTIDLLKSTSLAFTLGVAEIMAKAQMEAASSFKFFESFLVVACIYWFLVVLMVRIQSLLENKLGEAY
ncbi:amino acid ABC transporter membrane protein (PAAT family) [Sinobacterium caligoides]|uniref:Amino acid ABC transporter membrane protein (PAAT family) n=1 Tax=Sinobacterium caligoides TaxID=933926 RepID=A0A3N2DJE7_9GAMM|nr:amino acid ABC transporter permease [Sinobacterium caligoides]ROR99909.1 amino acid ABC transporter membrane protein (PAAT family) [Sinobacterium caligoides]